MTYEAPISGAASSGTVTPGTVPSGALVAQPIRAETTRRWDAVVVGSGIAGLTTALGLAPRRVAVITKATLGGGSSSEWAQGGVAAAMGSDDSPAIHTDDTLRSGAGLSEVERVRLLTSEGPEQVRRLIELGGQFDRDAEGKLRLGREGAHSRRRILHAQGDATGREMVRTLVAAVRAQPSITVLEETFALDLVLDGERVVGVLAHDPSGSTTLHLAPAVVLASGGFGQLFARTTNPTAVTGDGLAMAARAGARLIDLEFVQFHPTALDSERDPLPLVTEALRGEGSVLLDDDGERFMLAEHPLAELAPRDIVARAILRRQRAGHRVVLDARQAVGESFPERFPTVWQSCIERGIDPRREPIPVTPAAHYAMAGVATDNDGRTSLAGLWACGEVSSTGVHGANRLASNSLLEALVFGARVAEDITDHNPGPVALDDRAVVWRESRGEPRGHEDTIRHQLRQLMWQHVGLLRDRPGLEGALDAIDYLAHRLGDRPGETANLLTVGRLVAAAALARCESRGAHHRLDFPRQDEQQAHRQAWTYHPGKGFPLRSAGEEEAVREIA